MADKKIGLFGGTFDPVHKGHIALAKAACAQCGFDELVIVPCARPPHREIAQASNEQRLHMLSLAFSAFKNVHISDYEIRKTSVSYTVETLEYLIRQRSSAKWFFCLGGDSLAHFTQWHRWSDILGMADLVVMTRSSAHLSGLPETIRRRMQPASDLHIEPQPFALPASDLRPVGQIIELEHEELDISATEIRQYLKSLALERTSDSDDMERSIQAYLDGDSVSPFPNRLDKQQLLGEWLTPSVMTYLLKNKVYQ